MAIDGREPAEYYREVLSVAENAGPEVLNHPEVIEFHRAEANDAANYVMQHVLVSEEAGVGPEGLQLFGGSILWFTRQSVIAKAAQGLPRFDELPDVDAAAVIDVMLGLWNGQLEPSPQAA